METGIQRKPSEPAAAEDVDLAVTLRRKALKINVRLGSESGMAESYQQLAALYALRGYTERSERMFFRALACRTAPGREAQVAACHRDLGYLYAATGRPEAAEASFEKALALCRLLAEPDRAAVGIRFGMALSALDRGRPERAEELFREELAVCRRRGDMTAGAAVLLHLGRLLLTSGQGGPAVDPLREAAAVFAETADAAGLADALGMLGAARSMTGLTQAAETDLTEARRLNRRLGRSVDQGDNCAHLATLNWKQHHPEEAERLYNEALDLFEKAGHRHKAEKTRRLLFALQAGGRPHASAPGV